MAQKLFTESVEAATITFTNDATNSDEKLLKNRDIRVEAITGSAVAGNNVVIEIDYGTATTVDYTIIGNLTTSASVTIQFEYWTGASYSTDGTESTATYTNENYYYSWQAQRNATKYQITIIPDTTSDTTLACMFMGTEYDMPTAYEYNAPRTTFMRGEVSNDSYGYPYAHQINDAKKFSWDVMYGLTKTQLGNLETQMVTVGYNQKPFFFYDDVIDTTYRLVAFGDDSLRAEQPGYDYFKVPFRVVEL